MKRNRKTLDQYEVERLIYNDLDVMGAYPESLETKEEEKKLKKRVKELLVEGEFIEDSFKVGYVLTNYGRVIGAYRAPVLKMQYSPKDIFFYANSTRYKLSEMLPNFEYKETLKRLKDLGVNVSKVEAYY